MADIYEIPQYGRPYVFYVALTDAADTTKLKAAPTLAAGDVKLSKDGGTLANITTLPTVTPSGGVALKVSVSGTEMEAANLSVQFIDAAGAEWCDLMIDIQPRPSSVVFNGVATGAGTTATLVDSGRSESAAAVIGKIIRIYDVSAATYYDRIVTNLSSGTITFEPDASFATASGDWYEILYTAPADLFNLRGTLIPAPDSAGVLDANVKYWKDATAPTIADQTDIGDEVDTRLQGMNLDHIAKVAATGADVTDNSIAAQLVSKSATADWDDYDNTTDSLQAAKDSALTAAQVNAEALDVLNVDTYAEPGQGAPAATASLAAKINYLYKSWRNRKTQTSSEWRLYADDATTVDQKATVADSAGVTSKTEVESGP